MRVFLIGGGRDAKVAHWRFGSAAAGGRVTAFVLDEGEQTDLQRWVDTLGAAGVADVRVVVVSPARPPRVEDLAGVAGVYVAGGLTPGYQAVLVGAGTGWLERARADGLVYGGFSAGAAIAPVHALVGGWRTRFRGRLLEVCAEECGEDLDEVTVRPGLGLVPFVVDVHGAQWGTLNRLVHGLVAADLAEGWAIDEGTALEVDANTVRVHGTGAATRVIRHGTEISLTVHVDGDHMPVPGVRGSGC